MTVLVILPRTALRHVIYDMTTMIRACITSAPVLVGLAVGVVSLALYLATVAPTLTWGHKMTGVDGGELLAAADTFGVPHPPGYPTYTLLLKVFATVVPVGDFAFRGNILSAVLASVSVVLLYLVILRFVRSLRPDSPTSISVTSAALGASVFAASPLFWSQATMTEVYTLNAAFAGGLALLASRMALRLPGEDSGQAPDTTVHMALFGLLLGLGLGNHLTLLAVAVPLLAWLQLTVGWKKLASPWAVGALILGLGIYIYLPIRAASNPPINWGDAGTPGGFAWMITGRAYQDYVFGVGVDSIPDKLLSWVELVFAQLNPLGIFLGLVGGAMIRVEASRFALMSGLSMVALSVYSITYNTVDSQVLTIPAFMVFTVWVGLGFSHIATGISAWAQRGLSGLKSGPARVVASYPLLVLAVVAFGALPLASVILNYDEQNLRGEDQAYRYARVVVDSVPDGSLLLSSEENHAFSLWYMSYVEERERDIVPLAVPLLQFDWYWEDIQDRYPDRIPAEVNTDVNAAIQSVVEHNDGRSRVFFTFWGRSLDGQFDREESGNLFEAKPKQDR